jgi:toxin HigB-1
MEADGSDAIPAWPGATPIGFAFDMRKMSFYTSADRGAMIESFKHKGLKQLFADDNPKGVNSEHVRKIRQILGVMNAAQKVADIDVATFRLHPLTGDLKGFWSVTVHANWRIIFRFENGRAFDVDLIDYH